MEFLYLASLITIPIAGLILIAIRREYLALQRIRRDLQTQRKTLSTQRPTTHINSRRGKK